MDTDWNEFDVIICGGGPGGSTCALTFRDTGLRVAVLEKSVFPREKVCGDAIGPYIPKALDVISKEYGDAFRAFKEKFPVPNIFVTSFNGKSNNFSLFESFFIASRREFDNFLYELASKLPNVTYFLDSQVQRVEVTDDFAEVETKQGKKFRAKLVIGCDGATSIVRRSLTNFKIVPSAHIPAVRGYYEGVENVKTDTIEFYFNKKFPIGYLWIFPSYGNSCNVGFGIPSDLAMEKKISLRDAMVQWIEDSPTLKARFKNAKLVGNIEGWSIPLGYNSYPISGNRFMLVGDAASVADPLSGEGIGEAMVSGRIAGFHAAKCFKQNDFSEKAMKGYDANMEKKFGKALRRRAYFSKLLGKYPWMLDLLISTGGAPGWFTKLVRTIVMKIAQ